MARFEPRILRSVNFLAKFREESSKKQADELESLRQLGSQADQVPPCCEEVNLCSNVRHIRHQQ